MKKSFKTKLAEAAKLIGQAEELISSVKMEYWDTRERNDEYYGLEGIELELAEQRESLTEGFQL